MEQRKTYIDPIHIGRRATPHAIKVMDDNKKPTVKG
jgi:hypothetical protein